MSASIEPEQIASKVPDRVADSDDSTQVPAPSHGVGFPSSPTVRLGVWLLVSSLVLAIGLITALAQPSAFKSLPVEARHAIVAMLAGGIGGTITAGLGYLKHASERQDFIVAYSPWYVARPLMGMLVGLLFFCFISGGLLVTMNGDPEVDIFGLAGLSGLVGLFSKNALEKAKELFHVAFSTQSEHQRRTDELLEQLPEELRDQVREALLADPSQ